MKNTNCLAGVMCPKCGHTEDFKVVVSCLAFLTDEGTTDIRDPEWESGAPTLCPRCNHSGSFGEFTLPGFDVTFEVYTPLAYEMGEPDRRGWWMPGEWLHDDHPDEPAFEFDPEYYDPDEHESLADALVEWACSVLSHNGACHPSDSPSDHARWWSTEDEVLSYETGENIAKAFHFKGFSDELIVRINREMKS